MTTDIEMEVSNFFIFDMYICIQMYKYIEWIKLNYLCVFIIFWTKFNNILLTTNNSQTKTILLLYLK